jgi:RNA polymerase sigma-70 factor (ECF subfamily)
MSATSISLLQRLREHPDEQDWQRLVVVYRPFLLAFLRSQSFSVTDAEDLTQEVLAVVIREMPKFQHNQRVGAFRSWLRMIAVHRLRDFCRARQNRPMGSGDSDMLNRLQQLEDPNSALSGQWNREHDRHVVAQLLESIGGEFQAATWQAFRAVMLEGQSPAEAAQKLGTSVNAVLLAKSRILARLREEAQGLIDD